MYHLYHWEPNTLSLKVLLVLHETQTEFESHWCDFSQPATWSAEPFSASLHWNHGVEIGSPLLVDGKRLISDSTLIGYYIEECSAVPGLLPEDAWGRWQVGKWARFSAEVLIPAVHTLGCARRALSRQDSRLHPLPSDIFSGLPQEEQRQQWRQFINNDYPPMLLADCERRLRLAIKQAETALTNNKWLAGAAFTLADIDLFTGLRAASQLLADAFSVQQCPQVVDWMQRMQARPALAQALAYARTEQPEWAFVPGPENSRWG